MNRDKDWDGRPLYYDRHGQPMTMRQWAEKFEDENYTHIARDVIGPDEPLDPAPLITVSTFWRGVNHDLRHDEPLIYETLIIGGGYDATGMRYATEKQAREGHRRAVDALRAGRGSRAASPLAPPARAHITPIDEGHTPEVRSGQTVRLMAAIGGVPRTTNGGRKVLVSACSTRGGPGQEHQTKLAILDLVAVDQHRGVDRFMIDVRVVEAVEVDEQELSVLQPKLDVVAADGGVVEEDVAVRMPARRCDRLVEQELEELDRMIAAIDRRFAAL